MNDNEKVTVPLDPMVKLNDAVARLLNSAHRLDLTRNKFVDLRRAIAALNEAHEALTREMVEKEKP